MPAASHRAMTAATASFRVVLAMLLMVLSGAPALAQGVAGDIGGPCLADGTCSNGVCTGGAGASGICAPCGMPGQRACPATGAAGQTPCHLAGWGYVPVDTAQGTICANPSSSDCGQVGTLACDRDGRDFCYFGVATPGPGGIVCQACGGLGEACCTGTDRVCDTGTCQNGICRLVKVAPSSTIRAAIIACDFDAARAALARMPASDPDRDMLERWLGDAEQLEKSAADFARFGDEAMERARRAFGAGDPLAALDSHRAAREAFERARGLSRCPATAAAMDRRLGEATAEVERLMQRAPGEEFARQLAACDFAKAREAVELAEQAGIAQAASMRKRLEEARTAERQAREAFSRGRNQTSRGNGFLRAGRYADAVETYKTARMAFTQARDLTICAVTRDAIADAVRDLGFNELIAADAAAKSGTAAGSPPAGSGPTTSGTHPCLDSSIKPDAAMTSYMRYMGGGHATLYLKGQFICGRRYIGSDFDVFDGSTSTSYDCERKGDSYVNCKVINVDTITKVYTVKDGKDYHYTCGTNQCWMHITPVKGN